MNTMENDDPFSAPEAPETESAPASPDASAPAGNVVESAEAAPVADPVIEASAGAEPVASVDDQLERPAPAVVEPEGDLRDAPASPDAVSAAPPRPHASLVDQLELRWAEVKEFVSRLEGEIDGELGEVLALARAHLGA